MSGLDGDLASVDLETVHLLERVFQILGTVKADFAASLANALMGIGVGDLAALAEDVLQFAPVKLPCSDSVFHVDFGSH